MEPPAHLPPERRAAWRALVAGESQSTAGVAAAEAIGRPRPFSQQTVCRWERGWSAEYGTDVFASERREKHRLGVEAANAAMQQRWMQIREAEAVEAGRAAAEIRNRLVELLPQVGEGLSAREIRDLATAYTDVAQMAELLEGLPTVRSSRFVDVGDGVPIGVPEVDSGLLGSLRTPSDADQVTFEAAKLVVRRLRPGDPKPAADGAVIEASEAS